MEKERVTYQVKNLNHEIMRYMCENGVDKKDFPTPAQMQILNYIIRQKGKVYQRDIAIDLNLRRATLSEILKTMEKNELISRFPDETDNRIKEIVLSAKAKEGFKVVEKILTQAEDAIIKNISADDLEFFFEIIAKMQENIKNERMKIC